MCAKQILRVARGIVRTPARSDHRPFRPKKPDRVCGCLDLRAPLAEQPGEHLGLLADLLFEMRAHSRLLSLRQARRPNGVVPSLARSVESKECNQSRHEHPSEKCDDW